MRTLSCEWCSHQMVSRILNLRILFFLMEINVILYIQLHLKLHKFTKTSSKFVDSGFRIECLNLTIFFSIFTACQCNNQAKECNHKTGRCHCTTKGIIGEKCDRCDIVNHYYGDPVKNSCYCKYMSPTNAVSTNTNSKFY